jgi:hypothetical protein
MISPWFNPDHYAWIPGTVFGSVALLLGGLAVWLVPQGRAKAFIIKAWLGLWIVAFGLLGAGAFALVARQPWGVWYGLLLPGGVGVCVLGADLLVILKKYREVAQRAANPLDPLKRQTNSC